LENLQTVHTLHKRATVIIWTTYKQYTHYINVPQ